MSSFEEIAYRFASELDKVSLSVGREFRQVVETVGPFLTEGQLQLWAGEGVAIAASSYRSWEAAAEYFRVSPLALGVLTFDDFLRWARTGQDLAKDAPSLAIAYFRASPNVLSLLPPEKIPVWAGLGQRLYNDTWKARALSSQFYETSARLLSHLSVEEMDYFTRFLDVLAQNTYELAVECLDLGDVVLGQITTQEREPFLALGSTIGRRNWRAARAYFEAGPRVLGAIERNQRRAYLSLTERIAQLSRDRAVTFFINCAQAMGEIDRQEHGRVLALAREVLDVSADAAADFMMVAPQALRRVKPELLEQWTREGLQTLRASEEAGAAYFRLESNYGQTVLDSLSAGVELYQVSETLRMYCKALTGRKVGITSTKELTEKSLGWTAVEKATTEGTIIYLPPHVKTFEVKEENRQAYKVLATHQAGHLEFDSFEFEFDKPAAVFANLRPVLLEANPRAKPAIAEFETFFDLFPDRVLAKHVFVTAEDARIDHRVKTEYKGIARSYNRMQALALRDRPDPASLPLRQGLLEQTIRFALGQTDHFTLPVLLLPHFRAIVGVLSALCSPAAMVEDTTEATIRLYTVLSAVPNVPGQAFGDLEWMDVDLSELEPEDLEQLDLTVLMALTGQKTPFDIDLPDGLEGVPYEGPQDVEHWGEFKPEIVQALMKVRKDAKWRDDLLASPMTMEELRALLEACGELEIKELGEDDLANTAGLYVSNLIKEGLRAQAKKKEKQQKEATQEPVIAGGNPLKSAEVETFTYDEWDFRANDYKPDWCLVGQRLMEEGSIEFFDKTLKEHAALVVEIRRQFELLRPELFRKLKRLRDGEEFDLDAVIEALVEKKAGVTPSEKLYWRRNKVERSVAVVFLLDMSASTDEEIKPPEAHGTQVLSSEEIQDINRQGGWDLWDDLPPRGKRIIDLEKEGLVLLIKALETIGDSYGIYGFSGHGRENVEFYVLKDLDEECDDRVKKRIDKVAPIRATRMGPAIRHATTKLEKKQAKIRLLILISDGRPQDFDYGKDRTEKEYGIHDTKMALVEARRKGIIPFCLTVDRAGHDYLGAMCGDLGYEVVGDIESLPRRLPTLYRKLTS